jgi:hypothetical protein
MGVSNRHILKLPDECFKIGQITCLRLFTVSDRFVISPLQGDDIRPFETSHPYSPTFFYVAALKG